MDPALKRRLASRFGERLIAPIHQRHDETEIRIGPGDVPDVCRTLHDDADFAFRVLADLAGVDTGTSMQVVYHLWSETSADWLRVVADGLSRMARSLTTPLEVLVEVDSGLHRVGRAPGEETANLALAVARLPGLRLLGLLTHAGHAYRARSAEEREQIAIGEAEALVQTAELLHDRGIEAGELSLGSTPTLASIEAVKGAYPAITEIRPGTYVFNDGNLVALGVATEADCALSVLVTVVSRPTARSEEHTSELQSL